MSDELMNAIQEALEALLNVPCVGDKYDQQHSDTHMKAYLRLKDAYETGGCDDWTRPL